MAQFANAHLCKRSISWSSSFSRARKALDVEQDIFVNTVYVFGHTLSARVDTQTRRRQVEIPRHGCPTDGARPRTRRRDPSLKHTDGEPRWTAQHVRPHRKTHTPSAADPRPRRDGPHLVLRAAQPSASATRWALLFLVTLDLLR